MGQYYMVVNIDKKEYMKADGGVKLMEWSYNRNPLILNLLKKLANEWKGNRVFVVGDYALSKDRIHQEGSSIEKDYDYELLEKIEKELDIYNEKNDGYNITLYEFASRNFKELKLEKLEDEEYRFIYNHNKKEFIDLEHCPLAWLYKDKKEYYQVKISSISLVLALGNGMGGGDFWGNNDNMIGKYINDVEKLEITKESLEVDYLEFRPEFYEDNYIPYNEIAEEINRQKTKEKLAKRFVDFISEYDKENFKSIYDNKKHAIARTEYALDFETERKLEEINNITLKEYDQEVKEKGRELMYEIGNYKLEKTVRNNKSKSDIELKNELNEDVFINETYKRIFNDMKLKNIESITTYNKETTILFDTQEKYIVKTDDKNKIENYIDNSKNVKVQSLQQKEAIKYTELTERVPDKAKTPYLYYYEYREDGEKKIIEKNVWVDFAGTLVTNKDILKEKDIIDRNQVFNNPKILMLDDSDIEESVRDSLNLENEDEEVQ